MPIVRRSMSVLGISLSGKIYDFMKVNSDAMAKSKESTPEDGIDAIANAIAYGIAKSFQDPTIKTAFDTAAVLPAGGPIVPPIFTTITPSVAGDV